MTGDSSVQHTSSEDDDEDESGLSSAPISLNASTNDVAGIVRNKIITVQVSFTFTYTRPNNCHICISCNPQLSPIQVHALRLKFMPPRHGVDAPAAKL